MTGKPLFGEYLSGGAISAEDALEIAAAHRLQQPYPPSAEEPLLDQLVLRLLQKLPDDRYQTGTTPLFQFGTQYPAKGLIYDLEQIASRDYFTLASLKIGEIDETARFRFPKRTFAFNSFSNNFLGLYGRDEYLHVLMDTFRTTQLSGISAVCCVSGYAGAGKTYLIREAMERMKREGAITTSGKFDQYDQGAPYSAIVHSTCASSDVG